MEASTRLRRLPKIILPAPLTVEAALDNVVDQGGGWNRISVGY